MKRAFIRKQRGGCPYRKCSFVGVVLTRDECSVCRVVNLTRHSERCMKVARVNVTDPMKVLACFV